ncbi:LPXTG cell wall anchor domain-containing protein [Lactococcus protaetiae]|uniref:LPXTG cell wall anchor domain-containing protein n=1 Tax=Lactococcus protaetiae TaxID=2592653 RepID=A0A514ZB32_9LACT|nr:LPXTG cell wall anchor domain-containing protein [Lactococcus protaetiae]
MEKKFRRTTTGGYCKGKIDSNYRRKFPSTGETMSLLGISGIALLALGMMIKSKKLSSILTRVLIV